MTNTRRRGRRGACRESARSSRVRAVDSSHAAKGGGGEIRIGEIGAGEIRVDEIRAAQIGADQVGAAHIGAAELRPVQFGAGQVRACKVREAEIGAGEIRPGKIRASQVGREDIRPHEPHRLVFHVRRAIHLREHGLLEIRPSQIADQARARKVRPLQVGPLQLHRKHHRALQIGVGEVRAFGKADREIAPGEVGARKVAAVQNRRREIRSLEIDA